MGHFARTETRRCPDFRNVVCQEPRCRRVRDAGLRRVPPRCLAGLADRGSRSYGEPVDRAEVVPTAQDESARFVAARAAYASSATSA